MDRKKKNIVELTHCSVSEYKQMSKLPLRLLTDNVRSMYNIGSLLRTCDGFGIEEVILGGISGTPPHPEISKTALGAEESVDWRHVEDSVEECRRLQGEGWKVCVLEQTHNSIELSEYIPLPCDHLLLVVGNEVEGVNQQIVDMADVVLEMKQCGVKHSLNVSSSGAIALYFLANALRDN